MSGWSWVWARLRSAWRSRWRRTPGDGRRSARQELADEERTDEEPLGGEQPEGEQPEGEQPEGEQPEGEQPEGEQPEGEQPEEEQPEGEPPEEEQPEGEPPEEEQPEGESPEGEPPEEEQPEGERPEEEPPEGEPPEEESPGPDDPQPGGPPPREPRVRIVCRKGAVEWEVCVVPGPGFVARGKSGRLGANGEFCPTEFRNEAVVQNAAGYPVACVPLFGGAPMIFSLGTDWQGEGRKVGGVGIGHFIVIVPAEWTRLGDPPVEPEACLDPDFCAHYFFRSHGYGQPEGFVEYGVSSSVIRLDGQRVFDASDQGELFVGKPPVLKATGMDWVRVESGHGWGRILRLDGDLSLAEVLDGRQGWFFVRVYREGESTQVDSAHFRYAAHLREVRVAGHAYSADTVLTPEPGGHAPVDLELLGEGETRIAPVCATDGAHDFEVRGGVVECPPDPDASPLRCRLDGKPRGVDVVVDLPRVWWRLATPGKREQPWADTAQKMTREQFRTLASRGTEIQIRVPARTRKLRLGFGEDGGVSYRARRDGRRALCAVPLEHFEDHAEIDHRLFRDAVLGARCGTATVGLIRVTADPPPRIASFSVEPGRVSPGDPVIVRWAVERCEGVAVSVEPGIGPVSPEGTREIRLADAAVVTITLAAAGMEDRVESLLIDMNETTPVASTGIGRRRAKGFSPGEVAAVTGAAGLPIRVDRRRRSVHQINVVSLERRMSAQR